VSLSSVQETRLPSHKSAARYNLEANAIGSARANLWLAAGPSLRELLFRTGPTMEQSNSVLDMTYTLGQLLPVGETTEQVE
jgi:hypothetical protein